MNLNPASTIDHRTSSIERKMPGTSCPSTLDVRRCTLDVGPDSSRQARRGFSFAEVMFAVVILGIGFIMVAAIFPVAIQQTQSNGEQNIAASLARQAANAISQMPSTIPNPIYIAPNSTSPPAPAPGTPATIQTLLLFPPTVKNYVLGTGGSSAVTLVANSQSAMPPGTATVVPPPAIIVPLTGNCWDAIKNNVIQVSDPRYAYVTFYKRENSTSTAQLIVVAVAIRNRSIYTSADIANNYGTVALNTQVGDTYTFSSTPGTATTICPDVLTGPTTTSTPSLEGYYVEVQPLPSAIVPPIPSPYFRSYTLGSITTGPTGACYEITPGNSMELTAGSRGLWGTTTQSTAGAPAYPVVDTAAAATSSTLYAPSTLQPVVAYAQMYTTGDAPAGRIHLDVGHVNSPTPLMPPEAAPGAFVIIADDFPFNGLQGPLSGTNPQDYSIPPNITQNATGTTPVLPVYSVGGLNGRIFRLGQQVTQDSAGNALTNTFNLDPQYGMRLPVTGGPSYSPDTIPNPDMAKYMQPPMINFGCAKVYIIGAGRTIPTSSTYSGPAQDIGVFTSFFQVQ